MYIKSLEKEVKEKSFITITGNSNSFVLSKLMSEKEFSFVLNKFLNIFNGETVEDEIAFGLESKAIKKDLMKKIIKDYATKFELTSLLDKEPSGLGSSEKAKVKICSALICRTKCIVINEIFSELDKSDLKICLNLLNEYVNMGGIIINVTSDIEESLYGNEIVIYNDNILAVEGKTLSVLNEEKIMKRLGIGLPFFIELSKYLKDYEVIKNYHTSSESLVNEIWK